MVTGAEVGAPAGVPVVLRVDGRDVPLPGAAPTVTLLAALRARGFVGTKEGCGDGDCGACTVALVGTDADGGRSYRAVNSCLVPVGSVVGVEVLTVEGVSGAGEELHPVQQAMVECAGSQCGYCTPGFVMSMVAGYHDPHARGEDGLDPDVVEGNLCRCTGYASIRRACARLGTRGTDEATGPRGDQVSGDAPVGPADGVPVPRVPDVPVAGARAVPRDATALDRPAAPATLTGQGRTFHRPTALADALDLLARHPGATVLAGGTDLGLELSHRTLDPAVRRVGRGRRRAAGAPPDRRPRCPSGRASPLTRLEREAAGLLPALDEMLRWFAARQVRNRATLGGNLGTASPDRRPAAGPARPGRRGGARLGRRRRAPSRWPDFFTGYRQTVRRPDELVERVDLPLAPDRRARGRARRTRSASAAPTTSASSPPRSSWTATQDGVVRHARLAYGGVAATPVRALRAEAALVGAVVDEATVARVAALLAEEFTPLDDLRGSAAYRRRLTGSLFEKFARRAPARRRRVPEVTA